MRGQIHFQYRCLHDVVLAYVDWHLETPEDLDLWYAQYESYFKGRFPGKVDLILELSKFKLSPRLAPRFRELRNRILQDYTHRSYRVKEPAIERAMMYAGYVLHGGPANHFDTIEDALTALLEDRASGDDPDRRSSSQMAKADSAPPIASTLSR